jgi:hypothetical protein
MALSHLSPYTEIRVPSFGGEPGFLSEYAFPVPFLYGYGLFIHQKIQHPPDDPEPARIISVFT